MVKNVLGKGIEALIPDVNKLISPDISSAHQKSVPISQVVPNPAQPRKAFKPQTIQELADSISQRGILQPIIVREKGTQLEIVCGERRYRAALQAGLKEIPVIIKNLTDSEALQVSLIENLQREDLTPLDEAEALQKLCTEFALTHDQVAKFLGKSRSVITNTIRLLKLPDKVRQLIQEGRITKGHAISILMAENEAQMLNLTNQILNTGLTVREAEESLGRKTERRPKGKPDPNLLAIEEELQRSFGTKVRIITSPRSASKRGKIEFYFYSNEDFERIISKITQ